jgi:pimeloyl-ACP methyl ester carboxylesterase
MTDTPTASGARLPVATAVAVGAVLAAAGTALWTHLKARRAEREHPPPGRFVEVDGVRLHYVERGEGPTIVLLHGNMTMLQDFVACGLFARLAARHRVIAFDRPGFGFSTRPRDRLWTASAQARVLDLALARMGIERPVVLGHSWGTLAALAMALDRPDRVRGLVLVSGYYYPTPRLDAAVAAPAALPVLGDAMRYTISPVTARMSLRRTARGMFAPQLVPRTFFDLQPRELLVRPSQIRAAAQDGTLMVPGAAALRDRLGELKLPLRLFAGTDDRVVDCDAQTGRLHRELPHSELGLVPGAGHMVHYAVPDWIAAAAESLAVETTALTGPALADRAAEGPARQLSSH